MSFRTILGSILEECPGGLGAALMSSDGIPIEQVEVEAREGATATSDVASVGVEFGRVLDEVRKASDCIGGGALAEMTVKMSRFWVLIRTVDEETNLIVILEPDGNLGKARYLMRSQLPVICEEL